MMQDKFSIDDQFRARLSQTEMTPPPMVWANVATELARQKRRKVLGLWAAGGLATVGVLAVAWLFYSPGEAGKSSDSAKILTEQNESAAANSSAASAAFEKNQVENQSNISAQNQPDFSTEKAASIASFKKNQPKFAAAQPVFIEKNGAALGNFKPKNLTGSFPSSVKNSTQSIENQLVENFDGTQIPAVGQTFVSEKGMDFLASKKANLTNFDGLAGRDLSFFENKKSPKTPPFKTFKLKKKKPVCPSFADRGEVFFLDFYAGPGMSFHSLSAADSDSPGYIKRRKETEKSKFAWSAGVRAGWLFASKYLLRTGLQYNHVVETLDFYDPKLQKIIITIDNETGNRDTAYFAEHFVRATNNLGFLDLPITVGIEQGRGAFGWSLNGGVAANLLFFKEGKIVKLGDVQDQPTYRRPSLKANAGLSLVANAQFFYQIDKKSRVFVEPSYQRILQPVSRKSVPAEERYSFGGLSFGYTRVLK